MSTRRFLQNATAIVLFAPVFVMAECYQESVTTARANGEIKEVADFQKFVRTQDNQQFCTVLFKAKISNKWHDARGESQGSITDSTDQVCAQAMQIGRAKILEKISGTGVQSNRTLYCNDFEIPNPKKGLKKFDTFKVSELKPLPNSEPFEYKGSTCRYFLESDIDTRSNNLMQWQIVGCVIRNEWTVIDKF